MAYFRQLEPKLSSFLEIMSRDEGWLILVNADPDALASAMALKRILSHRVKSAAIANVNEISRPDNLAMIRYLRIPVKKLTPNLAAQYDRFALVDSQPHHHPAFRDFSFSAVFDHHPLVEAEPVLADYKDIKPEYGANASLMTEYLYNLGIRPGKLLATALLYGIKTDTNSFERGFCDVDVRAFRYLSKFSNQDMLRKIVRSEFLIEWLDYFSLAFRRLRMVRNGLHVWMGEVDSPDILVILADFFLRVHEINWTCVGGQCEDRVVLIFRGDGLSRDVGRMAANLFGDLGSAGGHKAMARAEFARSAVKEKRPDWLVWRRLSRGRTEKKGNEEAGSGK